jgi:hypothetical protein
MRLSRAAPVALAALACAVWLALDVRPVDLAASDFRAALFGEDGFTLWNGHWYGGHHTLTYSVLAPPLTWLVGSIPLAIASVLTAALLFDLIARRRFGPAAWLGSVWFSLGAATLVFHGRVTFALGVALGLGALATTQRNRTKPSVALALATGLASPVAGLFLALAGVAARRPALVAALAPVVLLAAAFPDEGRQTYKPFELVLLLASAAAVALAATWRRERTLQIGAALYALAGLAAYVVPTSLGNNVLRLAALFAGPLVICLLAGRRLPRLALPAVAAVLAAIAYGQWRPAINDVKKVHGDPAAEASYYEPLNDFLDRHPGAYRVEIPFTRAHWEAAEVAPRHVLARGWQRQLDVARNPLFYGDAPLDAAGYETWLRDNGVRYVALPDATLDVSATDEGALIAGGLPYLEPVHATEHWRVYEYTDAQPVAKQLGNDELTLDFARPGSRVVRVAWSPYWRTANGCVARAGDWTRVSSDRPGTVTMEIDFSLARVVSRGRRCG